MNRLRNNDILAALSEKEYERFTSCLEPVQLSLDEILIESNQEVTALYFPTEGMVSLISIMLDGSTTEIGLIGTEGMVGTMPFLGAGKSNSQSIVQAAGWAMKIELKNLKREYNQSKKVRQLILSYALELYNQVSQCAACNNHHTVKQRTARWLLMLDDRSEQGALLMTQQLLSKMLGVRRTGVTQIAKDIQRQGIIDYRRGKIEILDRQRLEEIACECYKIITNNSYV